MGVAVIEDICLLSHLNQPSVVIAKIIHRILFRPSAQSYIPVGYNNSPVDKITVRISAHGMTQFMSLLTGIDQIIQIPITADAGRLPGIVRAGS